MTEDILKNSLAQSVRYLRAYGEERLRDVEDMWKSLEDDVEPKAVSPEVPLASSETPININSQQAVAETPRESISEEVQEPRSFLQRLLGW